MIAFQRDEHEIALRCVLQEGPLGNAIASIAIKSSSFSAARFTAPVSFAKPSPPASPGGASNLSTSCRRPQGASVGHVNRTVTVQAVNGGSPNVTE
jgi:hypothetical protein